MLRVDIFWYEPEGIKFDGTLAVMLWFTQKVSTYNTKIAEPLNKCDVKAKNISLKKITIEEVVFIHSAKNTHYTYLQILKNDWVSKKQDA